ncbi:MAG: deoxyguanosinetriphosphate triphosphohydrolase [Chloroflexi bacterium]|nr:deoxyguanosinetriphosphate triphosphohydrolase [Chloroflexota bacterium]
MLEERLSPYASRSHRSQGRERPEEPSLLRTEFQRDRDRIIHTNAFRRLKHKTQVFIAPSGDHYVTRLTHTLEVAQIGRTIARALNLNEDLVEAMSHGHDLGHTPFGHVGEATMDQLSDSGFAHSVQSLRIVERLEKDGEGLNLTWEVRQGIVCHSKPRGDFLEQDLAESLTLEGQILRVADSVAYLNHDIADAVRAGILRVEDLPKEVNETLGTTHSQRIDTLVTDIVGASWDASGEGDPATEGTPGITMSPPVRHAANLLREFMFQEVYLPLGKSEESEVAREIIRVLFQHFVERPEQIPQAYFRHEESENQAAVDYLSGMTDHYAIRQAEALQPGISRGVFSRVPLV